MLDMIRAALAVPAVWCALALQLADVATTIVIVDRQGGTERNPVVAALMDVLGRAWPAAKLLVTVPAVLALAAWPLGLWLANAAMAAVVIHNFGQIRRSRR